MLEVKNVCKNFGDIQAVRGVSFEVKKGEVLGFLGPNGAGKTTTMRMITGFLPPTSGTATICGYDITTNPVEAKKQIGYLPENAPAYDSMTVSDFLGFIAEIRGFSGQEKKDRIDATLQKCRLDKVRNQTFGTLSKGYRQRTCFAQAILHNPPVLIMDEPTDGLDPNQKHVVRQMIKEMASEKVIIVSTHILEEVESVCTRAIIISNGTIVANGTPDDLKKKSSTGRLDDVFRMLTLDKEDKANG
ncbi:MAG: multidrug ABC transporter ATP-binding protein [Lentisphaerae bacterium RIFOXYA12_FULL_48_11]|nr:MAG: multidrug ABC transporter ATP-binding protein [Lentisphaerae bacterium RIFOXYA12_FULL_48_11]